MLAALLPGIYSTVNFEYVQQNPSWRHEDGAGRAGGCRGSQPQGCSKTTTSICTHVLAPRTPLQSQAPMARELWSTPGPPAVGPTQEIKPSSSVVSEQCPQELVFPGSGAACAVSRMRHHPFSRTNNRQELPLAAAPTSSGCPRGDPFPPDDLPASSPAAQQSSITSGFLTLKLGRGGGVRVAFVCKAMEKALKTSQETTLRICLSSNLWQLYLCSAGVHIRRSSPDCLSVLIWLAAGGWEAGEGAGLTDGRGHGEPRALLLPCAAGPCAPPKLPSSAPGCPAAEVTPNLQPCPQPSDGLLVSWSTWTSVVTQEAGLVKSIGKKGRGVSEILSGACKSTLPKGR